MGENGRKWVPFQMCHIPNAQEAKKNLLWNNHFVKKCQNCGSSSCRHTRVCTVCALHARHSLEESCYGICLILLGIKKGITRQQWKSSKKPCRACAGRAPGKHSPRSPRKASATKSQRHSQQITKGASRRGLTYDSYEPCRWCPWGGVLACWARAGHLFDPCPTVGLLGLRGRT